jgi:P-type Mg2+ transporter
MNTDVSPWISLPAEKAMEILRSTRQGLSAEDAADRLKTYGPNRLKPKKKTGIPLLFLTQFKSPIILILLFAGVLSFFLHDPTDGVIILVIIIFSGFLGFWQEKGAVQTVEKLLAAVEVKSEVLRDGKLVDLAVANIVPGDIILLRAGDVIPADALILESKDLFVDEAMLTGETFPVEKSAGTLPLGTSLARATNALFMGTHVISGTGKALVIATGRSTEMGKISDRLRLRPPETEFERGIRRFGFLLLEITLVLVLAIFAVNVFFARPVLDSFLFAMALAVGLTPQLLPAIISINLAHGANQMAREKVIVKRLASIENFGSMNVLCSDKTGTLTEGVVRVQAALDAKGIDNEKVLFYAHLNSSYESGFANPIDESIRKGRSFDLSSSRKLDEVPFDFIRKRLSILVALEEKPVLITKGALLNVLSACTSAETSEGGIIPLAEARKDIERLFRELSSRGLRTLGVAYRILQGQSTVTKIDEKEMTFLGLLAFADPIKSGIMATVEELKKSGITFKIITGDNELVAADVTRQVGLLKSRILTGPQIRQMSDSALMNQVRQTDVFAEIEPNQKERIILALQKSGNVVGYLGDGINDAPALHASDVGISVDSAVDVAKEAADIVLLEKDLAVLVRGVQNGRRTFANTLKYVFMATSANFGNMFSMAGASLFLPFLPLLPKQILLTNLLTDFPEMSIAGDRVDREMLMQPRRWNIKFIRNFMLVFGPISSIFDFLTFGILLLLLHAPQNLFRTAWFMESVISASLIVLVVRTRRPFVQSRPGKYLLLSTLIIAGITLVLPYLPVAVAFGFTPVPVSFFPALGAILILYILAAEIAKRIFYKKAKF